MPQAVVEYTYDELERVEEASYYNNWTNETISYGYLYASDGNLAGITKNGELLYVYDYDTLGRLIHSSTKTTTQVSQIKYENPAGSENIIPAGFSYFICDTCVVVFVLLMLR